MATLYLVRHGKPASAFDADLDPGLDDVGRQQATAAAEDLAPLGPLPIFSSPLARARETAEPLAARWERAPRVETRVAELPSPTDALAERARFVRGVMAGVWSAAGADLQAWRRALVEWVGALEQDCVVFSHFIAINATPFWPRMVTIDSAATRRSSPATCCGRRRRSFIPIHDDGIVMSVTLHCATPSHYTTRQYSFAAMSCARARYPDAA